MSKQQNKRRPQSEYLEFFVFSREGHSILLPSLARPLPQPCYLKSETAQPQTDWGSCSASLSPLAPILGQEQKFSVLLMSLVIQPTTLKENGLSLGSETANNHSSGGISCNSERPELSPHLSLDRLTLRPRVHLKNSHNNT